MATYRNAQVLTLICPLDLNLHALTPKLDPVNIMLPFLKAQYQKISVLMSISPQTPADHTWGENSLLEFI